MQESLNAFRENVNKAAYARYLKNKHLRDFNAQMQENHRQDTHEQKAKAEWLRANGYLDNVTLKYKAVPVGYSAYSRQRERENRARGGATEDTKSYLYDTPKEPLLNHAKSYSDFFTHTDKKTGEIQKLTVGKSGEIIVDNFDENSYRVEKYALQHEAREILKSITRNNGKSVNHPVYRVCNCLRVPTNGESLGIVKTTSNDSVRYTGLQTCGSVWHCPVCAARISEHRAKEVRYMADMWQAAGHGVIFITNTIRHGIKDDLRLLLDVLFGTVWKRYQNHYTVTKLKKELGYLGRVRAVEVTYGKNGWHPHIHEIWLIDKKLTFKQIKNVERKLFKAWLTTLLNAGMNSVLRGRGLHVQQGTNAAEYLAKFGRLPKWDMSKELTKSHIKHGNQSQTPFDLLRFSLSGDEKSSFLFREYAIAFSGKRQLYFSTGLKDYFLIKERNDIEIASSHDDEISILSVLTREQWRLVLHYGNRAILLNLALSGGVEAIQLYLSQLQNQKTTLNY